MKILVLNGSPRRQGTVATLLRAVADGAGERHTVEWVDIYDMSIRPCTACMSCRQTGECCLPADGGQLLAQRIREADTLVIGTPTYWANMSGQLKVLFDRIVPVFVEDVLHGFPKPQQKGKKAIIVTACSTPPPFDALVGQSRGAIRAVREVLRYGGYRIVGTLVRPGTQGNATCSERLLARAHRLGRAL